MNIDDFLTEINADYSFTGKLNIDKKHEIKISERTGYYYKENDNTYNSDMRYSVEELNYSILTSYSDTIYKYCGEDGFELLTKIFPTTLKSILEIYWEKSRKFCEDSPLFVKYDLEDMGILKKECNHLRLY